ncbi:MAG: rod shape-determining protein MreC [Blastocatellia bacterium]|nr:rod shape-determining protein MreC [Blastocatellia bacterium]
MAAHLIVVSLNRAPSRPDIWIIQAVLITAVAPVQSGLAHSISWIKAGWTNYFSLRDARAENQRLRSERAQVERENLDLREKIKMMEQVTALREWQSVSHYDGVQAHVIARDANMLFNTIIVDQGWNSGVAKDQPVVTADGLVGRVINAYPFSAQVLLITDERHGAGAIIGLMEEGRSLGVVNGKKDYLCEFRFIDPPKKVENGDQVITSGQDGIYPKGLLIGRVRRTDGGAVVLPQEVDIEPAAQLGKLETVSILKIEPNRIRQPITELTGGKIKQEKILPNLKGRR